MTTLPALLRRLPLWLGLALAIVMQWKNGWWLDDAGRMWQMGLAIWVAAIGVSFVGSGPIWRPALELWIGVVLGSSAVLMIIGPGTLFPIVIAVGALMAGLAAGAGWGIGAILRQKLRDPNASF